MIEPGHPGVSVVRQCELVSISRSGFHYQPVGETALNLALLRLVDAQFLETPWYGSRQMASHLRREGYKVGRKRIRRLMAKMGLVPIYQRPRTTVPCSATITMSGVLPHLGMLPSRDPIASPECSRSIPAASSANTA